MCGTKNFTSVRLYSAPQSHWTIVVILRICAYGARDQAGFGCKSAMDMPRIKPTKTSTRGSRSEPDVSDKRNSLGVLNPSRHPRGGFLLPPDSAVAIWPHALRRSVACERPSPSSGFDWRWSDRQPAPRSASPVATRRFAGSIQPLRSVASQTTDQPSNGVDEAAVTTARSPQPEPARFRLPVRVSCRLLAFHIQRWRQCG